ncbi:MAG: hydroxymethylglutaryl-CoA reductase, degradative [Thermoplasmata archaeon]|nr:hydroxymethylglutaryl-CoA reductase, degradative [Thermoplasmata archaeon]
MFADWVAKERGGSPLTGREIAAWDSVRPLEENGFFIPSKMIENVVGVHALPLGFAANFLINGQDYMIPMAIEEPSVVAAASHAAKLARVSGGFWSQTDDPLMIGQVQVLDIPDIEGASRKLMDAEGNLLERAREADPVLVERGGGPKSIQVRSVSTRRGTVLVVHLIVDCRDAMGANAVNTMVERIAPDIEEVTGGRTLLRIVSNLADLRLARSQAVFSKEAIGGSEVVDNVMDAYELAAADPYRCATHNKGIMNGVDAVVIATGNDFRAVEAGAHAFASKNGKYSPLTKYFVDDDGNLAGSIELPLAVGLIGGATAVHPGARANVKVLGVRSSRELAEVISAVGLAQNFAALRALATEGIQRGHMALHARNIAATAGAQCEEIEHVANVMVSRGAIRMDIAIEILKELREEH